MQRRKIVVVLKGYPRLSETFIAQELLGLERAGFDLVIVALRRPTDAKRHPVHD
ncbi:MAG: colanic acid biosynthesis glycosyltransferase WcaL, partial [Mesorhizobium sp.]